MSLLYPLRPLRPLRPSHKVGHEAETLMEDADFYEDYAFGIIDKAEEKEARMMLLATDARFPEGAHRSCLDVAIEDEEFACMRFLKHRHCKKITVEVRVCK